MNSIRKIIVYLLLLVPSYAYTAEVSNINEDVEDEDLQEIDEDKDTKDNNKSNNEAQENNKDDDNHDKESSNIKDNKKEVKGNKEDKETSSGWYSGLDVKVSQTKLIASETIQDNKFVNYDIKQNLISPTLTLGYDKLLNNILMIGGECNVAFNWGSNLNYKDKVYDTPIAKINKGINFTGSMKLGFAIKSWRFYGKVGGDLSQWKYTWQNDNYKKNDNKKYIGSLLYGAGIEKQFKNNWYLRTEFAYNPNSAHADTNTQVKDCKLSDIKTNNYQISIGTGYRF